MRQLTTHDLFSMEIINLCDGGKLGCPTGLEICCEDGRITSLLVPESTGFSLFGKNDCFLIPWCKIECIGEDTILVKLTAAELDGCACKPRKGGKFF